MTTRHTATVGAKAVIVTGNQHDGFKRIDATVTSVKGSIVHAEFWNEVSEKMRDVSFVLMGDDSYRNGDGYTLEIVG